MLIAIRFSGKMEFSFAMLLRHKWFCVARDFFRTSSIWVNISTIDNDCDRFGKSIKNAQNTVHYLKSPQKQNS